MFKDLLNDLKAKSADEIADMLTKAGALGFKHNAMACPLAIYLTDEAKAPVFVSPHHVSYFQDLYDVSGTSIDAFVQAFDSGKYPDLDARVHAAGEQSPPA